MPASPKGIPFPDGNVRIGDFAEHMQQLAMGADAAIGTSQNPVGAIVMFGGGAAPQGYLMCQGQAVSRATYSALFAVVGTSFGGGDGSSTFNVPNLVGKFPVGYAAGDTDFNALGKTGGAKRVTLLPDETPGAKLGIGGGYAGLNGTAGPNQVGANTTSPVQSHQNLPPYVAVNFIIKA